MNSPGKKSKMLEDAFSKVLKPAVSTIDMSRSQEFHLANEKEAHKWTARDLAKYISTAVELPQYSQIFESHGITGVKFITFASEDDLIHALGIVPSSSNFFHLKKMFSHVIKLRTKVLSCGAEKLPSRFNTWGTAHIAGWLEYVQKCPSCANLLLQSKLTGKDIQSVVSLEDLEILLQGCVSEEFQKSLDALAPYCYRPVDAHGCNKETIDDLIEGLDKGKAGAESTVLEKQMVLQTAIVEDELPVGPTAGSGFGRKIKKRKGKTKAKCKGSKGVHAVTTSGNSKKETAIARRLRLEKEETEAVALLVQTEGTAADAAGTGTGAGAGAPTPPLPAAVRGLALVSSPSGGGDQEQGQAELRKSITFNPTELAASATESSDRGRDGEVPVKSILKHPSGSTTLSSISVSASDAIGATSSDRESPSHSRSHSLFKKTTRKKSRDIDEAQSHFAAQTNNLNNSAVALNAQLSMELLKQQMEQERRQFQAQLSEMSRVVAAQQATMQKLTREVNNKDSTLLEATQVFERTHSETARLHRDKVGELGRTVQELATEARADREAVMGLLSTAVELNASITAGHTDAWGAGTDAAVGSSVNSDTLSRTPSSFAQAPRSSAVLKGMPTSAVLTVQPPSTLEVPGISTAAGTRDIRAATAVEASVAMELVAPQMEPLMPDPVEEEGKEPSAPTHAPSHSVSVSASAVEKPTVSTSPITLPAAVGTVAPEADTSIDIHSTVLYTAHAGAVTEIGTGTGTAGVQTQVQTPFTATAPAHVTLPQTQALQNAQTDMQTPPPKAPLSMHSQRSPPSAGSVGNSATKLRELTAAATDMTTDSSAGFNASDNRIQRSVPVSSGGAGGTRYRAAAHPIVHAIKAYEQLHPLELQDFHSNNSNGSRGNGIYSGDIRGVIAECERELEGWRELLNKYRNSKAAKLTNSIGDYQLLRVSTLWCELGLTVIDDHLYDPEDFSAAGTNTGADVGAEADSEYLSKARRTLFNCAARLTAQLDIPTPPAVDSTTTREGTDRAGIRTEQKLRAAKRSNSLWATADISSMNSSDHDGKVGNGDGSKETGMRFTLTATELRPLSSSSQSEHYQPQTLTDSYPSTAVFSKSGDGNDDRKHDAGVYHCVNKYGMAVAAVFVLGIVRKLLNKYSDLDAMQVMHMFRQLDPTCSGSADNSNDLSGSGFSNNNHKHSHSSCHHRHRHHTSNTTKYLPSATCNGARTSTGTGTGTGAGAGAADRSSAYSEDDLSTSFRLPVQELGRDDLRTLIEQTLNVNYKGWEQFDSLCQKIDVHSKGFVTLEQVVQSFVAIHPLNSALMHPNAGLGLMPTPISSLGPGPNGPLNTSVAQMFQTCKVASVPLHCVLYIFSLLTAYTAIPLGGDGADVLAEKARMADVQTAKVAVDRHGAVDEDPASPTSDLSKSTLKAQPKSSAHSSHSLNSNNKTPLDSDISVSYQSNQGHITTLLLELMMSHSARIPSFRRYLNKAAEDAAEASAAEAAAQRAATAEAALSSYSPSVGAASDTSSAATLPPSTAVNPANSTTAAADTAVPVRRDVRIVYTNYSAEDEGYIADVGLITDLMYVILSQFLHDERDSTTSIQSYCAYLLSLAKRHGNNNNNSSNSNSNSKKGGFEASSAPVPSAVPIDSLFVSSLMFMLQPDQLRNTCHAIAKELQIYYYGRSYGSSSSSSGREEEVVHPLQSFIMLLLTFTSFSEACHNINAVAGRVSAAPTSISSRGAVRTPQVELKEQQQQQKQQQPSLSTAMANASGYEYLLAKLLGFPVPVPYRSGNAHSHRNSSRSRSRSRTHTADAVDFDMPVGKYNVSFPPVLTPLMVSINMHLHRDVPNYINAYMAAQMEKKREREAAIIMPGSRSEFNAVYRNSVGSPGRHKGKPNGGSASASAGSGVIQGVNDLMHLQRVQQISAYLETLTAEATKKKKLLRFVLSLLAAVQKQTAVGSDPGSSISELMGAAGVGIVHGQSSQELVAMAVRVQETLIAELKEEAKSRGTGDGGGDGTGGAVSAGGNTKLQLQAARIDSYRVAYAKGLIKEEGDYGRSDQNNSSNSNSSNAGLRESLYNQLHIQQQQPINPPRFHIGEALKEIVVVRESVNTATQDIIRVVDAILRLATGPPNSATTTTATTATALNTPDTYIESSRPKV